MASELERTVRIPGSHLATLAEVRKIDVAERRRGVEQRLADLRKKLDREEPEYRAMRALAAGVPLSWPLHALVSLTFFTIPLPAKLGLLALHGVAGLLARRPVAGALEKHRDLRGTIEHLTASLEEGGSQTELELLVAWHTGKRALPRGFKPHVLGDGMLSVPYFRNPKTPEELREVDVFELRTKVCYEISMLDSKILDDRRIAAKFACVAWAMLAYLAVHWWLSANYWPFAFALRVLLLVVHSAAAVLVFILYGHLRLLVKDHRDKRMDFIMELRRLDDLLDVVQSLPPPPKPKPTPRADSPQAASKPPPPPPKPGLPPANAPMASYKKKGPAADGPLPTEIRMDVPWDVVRPFLA